jgi:hypothetical protein
MQGLRTLDNFKPRPIFDEIQNITSIYNSVSSHHFYRESNMIADGLSKAGLLMDTGQWFIGEEKVLNISILLFIRDFMKLFFVYLNVFCRLMMG